MPRSVLSFRYFLQCSMTIKAQINASDKRTECSKNLRKFIQLDDAYWGGVRKETKGRGAKGNHPFIAVVSFK
jgi:hypothetical protein